METVEYLRGFRKKDGSVVVKKTKMKRYVETGKAPNYSSKFAKDRISDQLKAMKSEILMSEKSSSVLIKKENSHDFSHRSYTESTFPDYMRNAGISTRKDFLKVISSSKGLRFERLKSVAIDRLNNGYQNKHGQDIPDMKFKEKTGQVYDNKNVIFRVVRGRVIRIKVKQKNRYDLQEEAPF